jgi:hypothetical protein
MGVKCRIIPKSNLRTSPGQDDKGNHQAWVAIADAPRRRSQSNEKNQAVSEEWYDEHPRLLSAALNSGLMAPNLEVG